jgi:hypothetical protein
MPAGVPARRGAGQVLGYHAWDLPAPADYDGDGKADVAIYRRGEGTLWYRPSKGGPDASVPGIGGPRSVPVPADYDGDGVADAATYDRIDGSFTVRPSGSGAITTVALGGRETMTPTRAYQVWKRLGARTAARVVVFGDSVAFGAGASVIGTDASPAGTDYTALVRQNDDAHWPSRSGRDLVTKFLGYAGAPGSIGYHKLAFGGALTKDVVDKELAKLGKCIAVPGNGCYLGARDRFPSPPPGHTIVIMDGGGNDLLSSQKSGASPWYAPALDGALANLAQAVGQIRQIFANGVTIYLTLCYDLTDGQGLPPSPVIHADGTVELENGSVALGPPFSPTITTADYFEPGVPIGAGIDAFTASYAGAAPQAGVTFLDVRPPFLGHAYRWESMKPGASWLYDVVHPNDQGHDALRTVVYPAIDADFDTL